MALARNVEYEMDELVSKMLDKGPSAVPCPSGMPLSEYRELQAIIDDVIEMYHPIEWSVPWQANPYPSSKFTLMDHIENRDYEAARNLLLVCGYPSLA